MTDILTLLSLAGMNRINSANDIYSTPVEIGIIDNNNDAEIDIIDDTVDDDTVDDLKSLLILSGQPIDCPSCSQPICQCTDVDESQANYDYGSNPIQKNGQEYDIDAYKFLGKDDLPVRYTPARSGDNPLTGKRGISSVSENRFVNYLKKIEERK